RDLDRKGARLLLKAKEYEQNSTLDIPQLPVLAAGRTLELSFSFDNPQTRKAFSFHLLGEGRGSIEIIASSVVSEPLEDTMLAREAAPKASSELAPMPREPAL